MPSGWLSFLGTTFHQHVGIALERLSEMADRARRAAHLAQRELQLRPERARAARQLAHQREPALGAREHTVGALHAVDELREACGGVVEGGETLAHGGRQLAGIEPVEL